EREHLEPRARPVGEVGTAVDLEDEPAAPAAARPDEPGVELVPVAVADRVTLGVSSVGREPAAAVARQPPKVAALDRIHLARGTGDACDDRDPASPRRQPRA